MNIWEGVALLAVASLTSFTLYLLWARRMSRTILHALDNLPDQIIIAEIEYQ
jgi:hypothetical protein